MFDGETYEPEHDWQRLNTALSRVFGVLSDGKWYTLSEIARVAQTSEAGASARIRDLRKEKFGSYDVLSSRDTNRPKSGLWHYRLDRGTPHFADTLFTGDSNVVQQDHPDGPRNP